MENKSCALILSGGEGKRMKSNKPKAMSEVLFKPMLQWVIDAVRGAGIEDICLVTGFKHEIIENYISTLLIILKLSFKQKDLEQVTQL